jgi:putative tryptophan/tyrosine transport system substrate-binding protein
MTTLSRRQVVQGAGAVGLGLLAGCGRELTPFPTRQPAKIPWIGYLTLAGPARGDLELEEAFRQGMRELGYYEGQNLLIETRYAAGQVDRLPDLAAELVGLPVDLIFAPNTPATLAAKQATATIPVVMAVSADPIGSGFINSLARPGGNVTGTTQIGPELSAKRLELLREMVPGAARVAVLWNPADIASRRQWIETQVAAVTLGMELRSVEGVDSKPLDPALDGAMTDDVGALLSLSDRTVFTNRERIAEFTVKRRLPAMYTVRDFVDAGGLMSYGPSFLGLYRRAAYYVDRILKGAQPADLPVEQPMTFDFVINLRTAQALGLTIPHHVLLQATEVIQ